MGEDGAVRCGIIGTEEFLRLQVGTLTVYDVLGWAVERLVNEKKLPGRYSLVWNAASRSSGVYFTRLIAGRFVETRKLILLK